MTPPPFFPPPSANAFGDEGLRTLLETLRASRSITEVDLSSAHREIHIGVGGTRMDVCGLLSVSCIPSAFCMVGLWIQFDHESAAQKASGQISSRRPVSYTVSNDNQRPRGGPFLSKPRAGYTPLPENPISDEGARLIGETLKANPTIRTIKLDGVPVGDGVRRGGSGRPRRVRVPVD